MDVTVWLPALASPRLAFEQLMRGAVYSLTRGCRVLGATARESAFRNRHKQFVIDGEAVILAVAARSHFMKL